MKKRWAVVLLLLSLGSARAEQPFYLSVKDNTLSARIVQPIGRGLAGAGPRGAGGRLRSGLWDRGSDLGEL